MPQQQPGQEEQQGERHGHRERCAGERGGPGGGDGEARDGREQQRPDPVGEVLQGAAPAEPGPGPGREGRGEQVPGGDGQREADREGGAVPVRGPAGDGGGEQVREPGEAAPGGPPRPHQRGDGGGDGDGPGPCLARGGRGGGKGPGQQRAAEGAVRGRPGRDRGRRGGGHLPARAAGVQLLGEGEDVPVAEAGGGAVGDAVGLQPCGDLQGVHGPLAQLAVPVQQCLDGIPRGPPAHPVGHRRGWGCGVGVDGGHTAASEVGSGAGLAQVGLVQCPGTRASGGRAKGMPPPSGRPEPLARSRR